MRAHHVMIFREKLFGKRIYSHNNSGLKIDSWGAEVINWSLPVYNVLITQSTLRFFTKMRMIKMDRNHCKGYQKGV